MSSVLVEDGIDNETESVSLLVLLLLDEGGHDGRVELTLERDETEELEDFVHVVLPFFDNLWLGAVILRDMSPDEVDEEDDLVFLRLVFEVFELQDALVLALVVHQPLRETLEREVVERAPEHVQVLHWLLRVVARRGYCLVGRHDCRLAH